MAISIGLSGRALPWLDRRRVLGFALAMVAALLVLMMTRPPELTPVLVASGDLQPGQPLTDQDVTVRYVELSSGMVVGSSLGELVEWSLRAPIAEGEPLIPSLLQPPELVSVPNVVALSLDPSHAVLGRLVAGDRVDVYGTTSGGLANGVRTELIASDVFVVEARLDTDGARADSVDLLLAVDDELAGRIVAADRMGEIDLVRVAP